MEKIHRGNGFAIIEKDGEFKITWAQGPYNEPVFYVISKENMEKAFKSEKDAKEVMIYAESGEWVSTEKEQLKKNKEFIRKSPELLILIPSNQELFTKEELEELLPLAKENIK